ncbi:MAG TPA: PHB depolymerase family esterase [Polyangiaceae bacterium]
MVHRSLRFIVGLPLLLALGCGGEDSDPGGARGPRSTGPGDWTAGDYPADAQTYVELTGVAGQADNPRQYKVHVPPGYDPKVPMPVVFCFHGLLQNAVLFCVNGAGMVAKSDEAGFIVVMPNGYLNRWNGGGCCGGEPFLDEVAFVRAVFAEISTHLNIDLDRVYATGLSNGGIMSYRLACDAADIFAAVAPGAGGLITNQLASDSGWGNAESDFSECAPSAPVSVLDLHGTADGIVPYSLQAPSLEVLARQNGCGTTTSPASAPESSGDTTCVSYTGCPKGIEVTGCSVEGGGHVWFGSENCGTGAPGACSFVGANSDTLVNTDAIWDFFSRHSK